MGCSLARFIYSAFPCGILVLSGTEGGSGCRHVNIVQICFNYPSRSRCLSVGLEKRQTASQVQSIPQGQHGTADQGPRQGHPPMSNDTAIESPPNPRISRNMLKHRSSPVSAPIPEARRTAELEPARAHGAADAFADHDPSHTPALPAQLPAIRPEPPQLRDFTTRRTDRPQATPLDPTSPQVTTQTPKPAMLPAKRPTTVPTPSLKNC